MRKFVCILAIAVMTLVMAGPALAQRPRPRRFARFWHGNVDKNIYADYKGQRVYFCCKGCDEEFKKNPEKYLEKMKSEGITPEKCPAGAPKTK